MNFEVKIIGGLVLVLIILGGLMAWNFKDGWEDRDCHPMLVKVIEDDGYGTSSVKVNSQNGSPTYAVPTDSLNIQGNDFAEINSCLIYGK